MQGKVAERRERAWARGDETACRRRQLEIPFGFRFEGGERPGAWGAGRWELETERERTRGQRHERQERVRGKDEETKDTQRQEKDGEKQMQITRSQEPPSMYNSKKPRIHTHDHSRTLTHMLIHTAAPDSETWGLALALPLTCCVTWQKTRLPLSLESSRALVSLSWFRGGQGHIGHSS